MAEHVFILLIAGSEYGKLNRILTELIHHIRDQVKTLLVCQSGNDTDQHGLRVNIQPEIGLQCRLVSDFLLPESPGVIILVNQRIRRRVESDIVNAVHDTAEVMLPRAHQAVKALAVIRHLDFFRISLRHGRDGVRINEAALQIVAVLFEFQLVRREVIIRKAYNVLHRLHIPDALELQVMDRHDGLYAAVEIIVLEIRVQIHRDEACLPVMAVDDIRPEIDGRKDRKRRFAEKCKPSQVPGHAAIRLVTGEIVLVVDEVEMHSFVLQFKNADIAAVPVKIHIKIGFVLKHILPFLRHT